MKFRHYQIGDLVFYQSFLSQITNYREMNSNFWIFDIYCFALGKELAASERNLIRAYNEF